MNKPKRMAVDEIDARYPDQWILIADPEVDERNLVVNGIPVFADPEKEEVLRKIDELNVADFAIRCTLQDDPNEMYVL